MGFPQTCSSESCSSICPMTPSSSEVSGLGTMYCVLGSRLGLALKGSRAVVILSHWGVTSGNFSVVCGKSFMYIVTVLTSSSLPHPLLVCLWQWPDPPSLLPLLEVRQLAWQSPVYPSLIPATIACTTTIILYWLQI